MRIWKTGGAWRAALWLTVAFCVWGAEVPRPSPPFTILRKGAPNIELRQYRGKVVALAFIATTCPHCQNLTRTLNALAREFAGRNAQFLECAFNDDAEATMPSFLELFQPPYPVGWSYQAPVRTYLKVGLTDGHFMVPHMVFLDAAGVIRLDVSAQDDFFKDSDASIRAALNRLLAPPPSKKVAPAKK
jgi:thiol-disulfide isomerase/thioredoxin